MIPNNAQVQYQSVPSADDLTVDVAALASFLQFIFSTYNSRLNNYNKHTEI